MIMFASLFIVPLVLASYTLSAIQHPTSFTSLASCVSKGASVKYIFEEDDSSEFILSLEKGVVIGEGAVVTIDGNILTDTEVYKKDPAHLLQAHRDISKENVIMFPGTLAVLSSSGQQCYYHWLLQIIPRLKILKESQLPYDKIYVHANNFKYHWQKDALYTVMDYLDIARDMLLCVEHDTPVEADTLLVPSVPWIPSKAKFPRAWYKQFFHDAFVQQKEKSPAHIFISRSKAQYRHISNETALMNLLNTKGFTSYCLEDLSISEQAHIFNNAKVIIGPHGAGWTNLIFCKPGTNIIEIDHGLKGNEQRSSFKGMSRLLGCFYHPFYTDLLEPTDCPENILDPINQDMTVDITAFEQFLEQWAIQ